MRPGSDLMRELLASDFELSFSADLMYGDSRVASGLEVVSPSVVADSSAMVEMSGRLGVVWADPEGSDVEPFDAGDLFSPFGYRVVLFAVVRAGQFVARQQIADLTITEVPSVDGEPFVWGQTTIFAGQRVDLVVKDRMVEVQRDRFTRLEQPGSLVSAWDEIGRLTGFVLTRSVDDVPITKSVVYEESRVDAVQQLAALLGGVAFMEWDGTLSVRSSTPGVPVAELTLGENGTIVSQSRYAVVGSGVMSAHDIRPHHDVDLIVTKNLFETLKNDGWQSVPNRNSVLKNGNYEVDVDYKYGEYHPDHNGLIRNAEIIDGVPFIRLGELIKFKKALGRDKDKKDIELIEQYLIKNKI